MFQRLPLISRTPSPESHRIHWKPASIEEPEESDHDNDKDEAPATRDSITPGADSIDASHSVTPHSKRKRSSRRLTLPSKKMSKAKIQKLQQEEEAIEKALQRESDSEEEGLEDTIRVANGRLMRASVMAQAQQQQRQRQHRQNLSASNSTLPSTSTPQIRQSKLQHAAPISGPQPKTAQRGRASITPTQTNKNFDATPTGRLRSGSGSRPRAAAMAPPTSTKKMTTRPETPRQNSLNTTPAPAENSSRKTRTGSSLSASAEGHKGDNLRQSKMSSYFKPAAPPAQDDQYSDTSSLSSLSDFEYDLEPKARRTGKNGAKKASAAKDKEPKTPAPVSGHGVKRKSADKIQSQDSAKKVVPDREAKKVKIAEAQTVPPEEHIDSTSAVPVSSREIPGTPEAGVTPPGSEDEWRRASAKPPLRSTTDLEVRSPQTSPRKASTSVPSVGHPISSNVSTPVSTPEQQLAAESQGRRQSQAFKRAGGRQIVITYDSSQLASLAFTVKTYPENKTIVQITGREFMDPKTGYASWPLFKSLVDRFCLVDLTTHRLLVNWKFRLMYQDDLDGCLNELCKHGKPLHDVVLFEMDRKKFIPRDAQAIMRTFLEKDLWKGKDSPDESGEKADEGTKADVGEANGDVPMHDAGTELSTPLDTRQSEASASAHQEKNVELQRSRAASEILSVPARVAAITEHSEDGPSAKRRAIELTSTPNGTKPPSISEGFFKKAAALITSPGRYLRNPLSRNGESSFTAGLATEGGNASNDVPPLNAQSQQAAVPAVLQRQTAPPAVTTGVVTDVQDAGASPETPMQPAQAPAMETTASSKESMVPQERSVQSTQSSPAQSIKRGRGRPPKVPMPVQYDTSPSKEFSIQPQTPVSTAMKVPTPVTGGQHAFRATPHSATQKAMGNWKAVHTGNSPLVTPFTSQPVSRTETPVPAVGSQPPQPVRPPPNAWRAVRTIRPPTVDTTTESLSSASATPTTVHTPSVERGASVDENAVATSAPESNKPPETVQSSGAAAPLVVTTQEDDTREKERPNWAEVPRPAVLAIKLGEEIVSAPVSPSEAPAQPADVVKLGEQIESTPASKAASPKKDEPVQPPVIGTPSEAAKPVGGATPVEAEKPDEVNKSPTSAESAENHEDAESEISPSEVDAQADYLLFLMGGGDASGAMSSPKVDTAAEAASIPKKQPPKKRGRKKKAPPKAKAKPKSPISSPPEASPVKNTLVVTLKLSPAILRKFQADKPAVVVPAVVVPDAVVPDENEDADTIKVAPTPQPKPATVPPPATPVARPFGMPAASSRRPQAPSAPVTPVAGTVRATPPKPTPTQSTSQSAPRTQPSTIEVSQPPRPVTANNTPLVSGFVAINSPRPQATADNIPRPPAFRRPEPASESNNKASTSNNKASTSNIPKPLANKLLSLPPRPILGKPEAAPASKPLTRSAVPPPLTWTSSTAEAAARKKAEELQRKPAAARLDSLNNARPSPLQRPGSLPRPMPYVKPPPAPVAPAPVEEETSTDDEVVVASPYPPRRNVNDTRHLHLFPTGNPPKEVPRPPAYVPKPRPAAASAPPVVVDESLQRVNSASPPIGGLGTKMEPLVRKENFLFWDPKSKAQHAAQQAAQQAAQSAQAAQARSRSVATTNGAAASTAAAGPSNGSAPPSKTWKLPVLERTGSPSIPLSLPLAPVPASAPGAVVPQLFAGSGKIIAKPCDMVFTIHRYGAAETKLCLEGIQLMKATDPNRLDWEKLQGFCTSNLRFDDYREAFVVNWCWVVEDQDSLDKGHQAGVYFGRGQGNVVVVVAVDETGRPRDKEVVEMYKKGRRKLREVEEAQQP